MNSSPAPTWHVPIDVLATYARVPEALDELTAASLEQHLLACGDCRQALAGAADPAAVAASWEAVADVVDQPRPSVLERGLRRLGLPQELTRLVGATPDLALAWFGTVLGLTAAAVLLARDTASEGPFLAMAPVVPLVAVLLTFLPATDPAGESGTATPLYGAGLALRRVLAVLVPTLLLVVVAGFAVPGVDGAGAVWVLPGLALAAASLALSTFVRATVAASACAVVWLAVLFAAARLPRHLEPLRDAAVFAAPGQLTALAVTLAAAVVLHARRDRFDTLEVTW